MSLIKKKRTRAKLIISSFLFLVIVIEKSRKHVCCWLGWTSIRVFIQERPGCWCMWSEENVKYCLGQWWWTSLPHLELQGRCKIFSFVYWNVSYVMCKGWFLKYSNGVFRRLCIQIVWPLVDVWVWQFFFVEILAVFVENVIHNQQDQHYNSTSISP